MQIRQLEYFIAVSESLNFTMAAKQFFISQSAISQQIRALEEELGFPLFERTNRTVLLTASGHVFLEDARAIVQRTRDAVRRGKETGSSGSSLLRIGFIKGFEKTQFGEMLYDFHMSRPGTRIVLERQNHEELYTVSNNILFIFLDNLS